MGFTRIENADLTNIGVIGLPDVPGLSTAAMQAKLEETSRSVVIPKHNGLIDELEDVTAAENIGMTAPTGRTGTTIKTVVDSVSNDLATLESGAVKDAYKNIESGGSTFVASGEDTFKINAGSNITITPLASPDKGISISASGGGGTSIGDMLMSDYDRDGSVKSASSSGNGIKDYVSTAISGKADSSSLSTVATTGAYSDLSGTPTLSTVATTGDYNDLSNKPTVPTKTSDLTNDSNFVSDSSYVHTDNNYDATAKGIVDGATAAINAKSTVAWSQNITTGQKIATVTIDGTPTDVYAPTGGGGGGGGAVDSVNGQSGTVVLDLNDINDVTFSGLAQNDAVVRNGSGKWANIPLPASALSGSYGDLTGKPNLATVATSGAYSDLTGTPSLATVATSGDYSDLSNTPSLATVATSGDYTDLSNTPSLSTVATSGSYSDLSNKPSIPADLDDLTDVTISGTPTNGDVLTYNSSSSAFVPQAPSGGGHTMIPTTNDIATIAALQNGNDNYVINAYSAKRWSNAEVIKILTDVPQNADTVGKWEDDGVWENYDPTTDNPRVYREGWLFDEALFGVVDDDSITIEPVFSINKSETISWYAYRLDDEVYMPKSTPTGNPKEQGWYELVSGAFVLTTDTSVVSGKTYYVGGGTVAFKMNGAVQNANGVRIGVALIHQRTEVHIVSPIS